MATFEEFLTTMRRADSKDDTAFQRIVAQAFELGVVTYSTAAHRFGTSRTSIEHWRLGTHAPHPAMRKTIYMWLATEAERLSAS